MAHVVVGQGTMEVGRKQAVSQVLTLYRTAAAAGQGMAGECAERTGAEHCALSHFGTA